MGEWRKAKKPIIVSIILIVACIVYFLFIHPFVTWFCYPMQYYSGSNPTEENAIYEFEYWQEFEAYLDSIEVLKHSQCIGYHYWDNNQYSSLAYGKIPSIMVIDYQLTPETYNEFINGSLVQIYEEYHFSNTYGYIMYFPDDLPGKDYLTFFALNEEKSIFRGFIITNADESLDIIGCLLRWSTLFQNTEDWKTEQSTEHRGRYYVLTAKTGDGSLRGQGDGFCCPCLGK